MNTCTLERQEQRFESKRTLLAYLRSRPKQLTIESFVCLTGILSKAGWRHLGDCWQKGQLRLPTLEAADLELDRQIACDKDQLLQQTVKCYQRKLA